jgi:hypothetical protein
MRIRREKEDKRMKRSSYRKSVVSMQVGSDMEDIKFHSYQILDEELPEPPTCELPTPDEQYFTLELRALSPKVTTVFFLVYCAST